MSIYTSALRFTGTSGIDVESMVAAMMKAESLKYDKLTRNRQLLQWKQQAYQDVSAKMKEFQSSFLNLSGTDTNMRSAATFNTYNITAKVGAADSGAVTATGTSTTQAGSYKIDVLNIAKTDTYSTVGRVSSVVNANLDDIDFSELQAGDSFTIALDNGSAKTITFTDSDVQRLKAAGTPQEKGQAAADVLNTHLAIFGTEGGQPKINARVDNGKLLIEPRSGHTIALSEGEDSKVLGGFGLASNTSSAIDVKKTLASAFPDYMAGGSYVSFKINGKTITINGNATVQDLIDAVNKADAGVKMQYDNFYDTLTLSATQTGVENTIRMDSSAQALFQDLGMAQTQIAEDAEFRINDGAVLTRSLNSFEISGLKIQLNSTTEAGKPVILTAEPNTEAPLDAIKKFVEGYNTMLAALKDEYSNNRSKANRYEYYMPLTADEKKNMTESEIKTWEAEAKKGLLYRDSILNDIMSSMRSFVYDSVELPNGKKITLYEIGITTSSRYQDGGKLIIDEEKLKKALTERAEDVAVLFTKSSDYGPTDKANASKRLKQEGIAERLNDIINNAISTNGSIGKKAGYSTTDIGSDMYKQLKDMDDKIAEMYKALADKEDRYYAQFSAMEQAMNKANSQMASLQALLTGGQ